MIYYLLFINLFSFILMKIDKCKAIKHRWRISENILMLSALLGGSLGIYAGMYIFSHKTLKMKFYLGIPLILLIQCVLIGFFLK